MAQEHDELLDHDYDGIREFDNPLPRWWLWLFYASIVFAALYGPYYLLGWGPTTGEMYEAELQAAQAEHPQLAAAQAPAPGAAAPAGGGTAAAPAALAVNPSMEGNPVAIAAGSEIFKLNCLPCHGPQGQGLIGPNLTDRFWLHGNTYPDIVATITNGVPDKGMIAWKAALNPEKIGQVAAFVMSLHGTNPPNPKPPQGKEYPE